MHKVIVSGANGFIGSSLVKKLIGKGIKVVALIHSSDSNLNEIRSENLDIVPFDRAVLEDVKEMPYIGYDAFYHLAWSGVSTFGRKDSSLQLQNVRMTLDALNLAHRLSCKKFIGIGRIMEDESLAVTNSSRAYPGESYTYGIAKLAAHGLSKISAVSLGVDFNWVKVTNTYGVGELSTRLISDTLRKIIQGCEPSFTSCTQNYDFIYIDDLVEALVLVGQYGRSFAEYRVGSNHPQPLKNFIEIIRTKFAKDLNFKYGAIPYSGVNLPLESFDCTRTYQEIEFCPKVSFEEGIAKTLYWMKTLER